MKIAFFWTWDFSKNILKWILSYKDIEVKLVVSQPDKPFWRKKEILETKVKSYSIENNLNILQPEKLKNNEEFNNYLINLDLDFIVVVAYWKIIPKSILDIPKYWCINIHWSILPDYRWASPIQESIKNWDKKTWLTIMYMSEGMDEWDILSVAEIYIDKDDKTEDIFYKFESIWPELLYVTLKWILSWTITWKKQDNSKATYCWKIKSIDWEINFSKLNSNEIYNKYRAYNVWPWIFTFYNNKKLDLEVVTILDEIIESLVPGKVYKKDKKNIWIVCKDKKVLLINRLKLEWKKSMDILSFINWNKDFLNYKFN